MMWGAPHKKGNSLKQLLLHRSGTDTSCCFLLPKRGCSLKPWLPWPLRQAGAEGVQARGSFISLCLPQTPEGIKRGNPHFSHAHVRIFPQQQTAAEETVEHLHLCSSSFSRESPHLRASSGVGLREDRALAR